MSKAGWLHGSTVDSETRQVRYLSSSSLQLADMSTDKGCTRKWWYAYVKGIKEEQTWQQAAGERDHACVEQYLMTGARVFTPRVAKGLHMLPPPGSHLQVEHDMVPVLYHSCAKDHQHTKDCPPCPDEHKHTDKCKKVSGLHLAPLRAAGIPVVGRIDLLHDLCINYGATEVGEAHDPEGTIEVFDHKFVKSLDYALRGPDLVKNIQMVAYGEYIFLTTPAKYVRLSHGYYPTNGNARKSTVLATREKISGFWREHVEPLARSIADAAKETNPDKVPANPKACKAFNRVCIHAEYCSAGMQQGLSAHVGGTAAQGLLNALRKPKDPTDMPLIPGKGLLAHIQKPAADTAAREAELAKLKAEEEAAKKAKIVPDWFEETWKAILAYDKGQPAVKGEAGKVYAAWKGYGDWTPSKYYGGTGEFGDNDVTLTEVAQFQGLLAELKDAYGSPPEPKTESASQDAGLLPDDAPAVTDAPPTENPLAQVQADADKPKTTTRKPRTTKAKVIEATATEKPTETMKVEVDIQTDREKLIEDLKAEVQPTTDTRVNLMVDVVIDGGKFRDFAILVDTLTAAMCQRFALDDIRAGGPDSPLGYGKWKAVLSAAIREVQIEAGTYYIDARGNEIYEEAVQALRQVVKRTGGYYARGAR